MIHTGGLFNGAGSIADYTASDAIGIDVSADAALIKALSWHLPGRSFVNENLSGQSA
jgi:hypothetical protein